MAGMWNCNCGYTNAGAKRMCTRCRQTRFMSPALKIGAAQLAGAPATAQPPGGLLAPLMDTNRHEDEYSRQIRGLAKQGRGRDTFQHPHATVKETKHPRAKGLLLHQGLGGVGVPVVNETNHAEGPLRVITERSSRRRVALITTQIPAAAHLAAALHPSVGLVAPDHYFTQPDEVIQRLAQTTNGQPLDSILLLDVGGPANTIRLLKGMDLNLDTLTDREDKAGVQSFMMQLANLVHPNGRIDLLGKNLYNTQEGQQLMRMLEQMTGRTCTYTAVMMNQEALHLHQHLALGGPEHQQVGIEFRNASPYFNPDRVDIWRHSLGQVELNFPTRATHARPL